MRRLPRSTLFPYTTLFRSEIRFERKGHRIALSDLTGGRAITIYGQPRIDQVLHDFLLAVDRNGPPARSEEHTSELQSRVDLVCRLLLEKKKTTITFNHARR